jgi:hypothetical protein
MRMYRYEYRYGRALWSCTRDGAGICGFGPTPKEAQADFLDKEQELSPPEYEEINHSREQPPELRVVRRPDPDRAYEDHREETA